MESLYTSAPPRQPLWKYSTHMELIDEHISSNRSVNYAVFIRRLEAIIYPGANQNDLYDWIYKMLKFRGDLFLADKDGKKTQKIFTIMNNTTAVQLLSAILTTIKDDDITRYCLIFDKPMTQYKIQYQLCGGNIILDNKLFQHYFLE